MTDYLLSLCASMMIVCLCPIARILQGSWVAPGPVLAIVWSVATLVPLVISPDYPAYPEAYFLALMFVVTGLVSSSLPILMFGRRSAARPAACSACTELLNRAYWIALALGAVSPILLYRTVRGQFGSLVLTELSGSVTKARYQGEFEMPMSATILNSFIYLDACIGGYLTAISHKRLLYKFAYSLFFAPLVVIWLVMTTRAALAYGGVLYMSGLIAGLVATGQEYHVRVGRVLRLVTALIVLCFTLAFGGMLLRWSSFHPADLERGLDYSRNALTGHMSVLGTWYILRNPYSASPSYGRYTFAGVFDKFGLVERRIGIFETTEELQDYLSSNVYTTIRCLIDDFTLSGCLLVFAAMSMTAGLGVAALKSGRSWGTGLVASFLAFVLWSPITSIFAYNSVLLALFAFSGLAALSPTLLPPARGTMIAPIGSPYHA